MNEDYNKPDMEEEQDDLLIMTDEDGNEVEFQFLDLIEYEGEEYVVLLPSEQEKENEDEAGEVVILKIQDSENEEEIEYAGIEDEDILNQVFEIFKEKYENEYKFIDEEEQ